MAAATNRIWEWLEHKMAIFYVLYVPFAFEMKFKSGCVEYEKNDDTVSVNSVTPQPIRDLEHRPASGREKSN